MFELTIIKKSRVEKLQAQLTTEKINASELNETIQKLRKENESLKSINKELRDKHSSLLEANNDLINKINELIKKDNYQVKALANMYDKYHRERDENGRFIKKQS